MVSAAHPSSWLSLCLDIYHCLCPLKSTHWIPLYHETLKWASTNTKLAYHTLTKTDEYIMWETYTNMILHVQYYNYQCISVLKCTYIQFTACVCKCLTAALWRVSTLFYYTMFFLGYTLQLSSDHMFQQCSLEPSFWAQEEEVKLCMYMYHSLSPILSYPSS